MEIITLDNRKRQKNTNLQTNGVSKGTELLEEKMINMKSASHSASLCKLIVKKITSAKENHCFKIGQQGFVVQKVKNSLFNKSVTTVVLSRNFMCTFNKKNESVTISQDKNSATFFLKKNIIKIKSNDFSFKKKCDLEQSLNFVLNKISKTGRLNFSITLL